MLILNVCQLDIVRCTRNICQDEQNCWLIWHSVRDFDAGGSDASRCVLNKGLRVQYAASKGVADCSAILADPRCVLNIKSSAVIPNAAPNTNPGLLVAMATALLSNIASSRSASLCLSLPQSYLSFYLCVLCVNGTACHLLPCLLLFCVCGCSLTVPMLISNIYGSCF